MFPSHDREGGNKTYGYGHKLTDTEKKFNNIYGIPLEEINELMAFLNTLGFKIDKTNLSRLKTIKGFEFRRQLNGLEEQMRTIYNNYSVGKIDLEKRNKLLAEIDEKYRKISKRFSEDMNVPVDYQEGAKLSEVVPRITSAIKEGVSDIKSDIKEQTDKIFDKN